ncbi:heme ABC transporter ATP-binding protein [Yinghuangia sp. YIM S09857]|uniref:heme ABC transporter ATP-binding protein n=1 Tax=Yinghuangia sp. YIM S09857 TaxID=3436929 RepID=UPI003F53AB87
MRLFRSTARGDHAATTRPPSISGTVIAEVRKLRVDLGGRTVLHDVDLQVRTGEVLALVGPNGAGKSTLLGAIAGDVVAGSGDVLLDGAPLASWPPLQLARRRAVLTQSYDLSFPFTVRAVVAMGRAPWARTPAEADDDAVVDAMLRRTETAKFARRGFGSLSGGERARVALARVLAQQAPLVMLDEPTAALDIRHQEAVLHTAAERARAGDAVVVVLHDLALAAAYADRVAVLHGGRVAACGPPAEVLTGELLSRVYRHRIEVIRHPRTGAMLITPVRKRGVRRGIRADSGPGDLPLEIATS